MLRIRKLKRAVQKDVTNKSSKQASKTGAGVSESSRPVEKQGAETKKVDVAVAKKKGSDNSRIAGGRQKARND